MRRSLSIAGVAAVLVPALAWVEDLPYGERPAVERHVSQADIEAGRVSLNELVRHGRHLFEVRFNRLDGQGRPATTGHGETRAPRQPTFIRTSGPDANSCLGCHSQPRSGGAADFAANVFVLAQELDPVTPRLDDRRINERGSVGMIGAAAIELLAREMTADLIAIRETAAKEARATGVRARRKLSTKGVSFGEIVVHPDGRVDPRGIDGVDWDLIVKPFHQKGAVVSIREFTNTALNHHLGIQSEERFGKGADPDGDGKVDELTVGDITALTLFQAALGVPGQVVPRDAVRRGAAQTGERLFEQIGCSSCHRPALPLNDPVFREPNVYNPPGNLRPEGVKRSVQLDLTREGSRPHLERLPDGSALVRAFTDLKRHDLNDGELYHFANEQAPQGALTGFAAAALFTEPPRPRPLREFLTRKLWDAGNSDPYGHRGDLTTLTEAIHFHGGEARQTREAYLALPPADRAAIIEFLKCRQVLPDGAPRVMPEAGPARASHDGGTR